MNEANLIRVNRRDVAKGAAAALGGSMVVLGLTAGGASVAQQASPVASPMASPASGATPVDLPDGGGAGVPMFRGNPARTGEMPGPGPDPANGVELLWSFATGGSVWSAPAVIDDVVYTGSTDSNVYAQDAVSSRVLWRFVTGGSVYSSPAVVDGVVYIGSSDSNVYALDAATGAERWRFATGGSVFSSPAVVDGVVHVGGEDFNVYALDAVSGSEVWRVTTGSWVTSSPAVVDGVVYVGSGDTYVYAIGARGLRLEAGGVARVTSPTSLRGGPASTAVERAELLAGTTVSITGEPETTDEIVWWPVTVDGSGDQGWVDETALEPTENAPG